MSKTRVVITRSGLRNRVSSLIAKLNRDLHEREEAVRLCVLCALARESIFLLGPPGVAKSLIARRIKDLFPADAGVFEYLMNRFSTPDEIFGPVSIAGLKADRLIRKTKSYLPRAVVVFLDEIWKAGPSIQNALLTAINERIFRNDGVDEPIPMRVLIAASNELPAEGEGLDALWDRFLVRLEVANIAANEKRHGLIRSSSEMTQLGILDDERFVDDELNDLDRQINGVAIPDEVLGIIDDVIARIRKFNHERFEQAPLSASLAETDARETREIYVSDRRWKKIGRLLRTSALCNGRLAVDELDCYLIAYCVWDEQQHIGEARRMVLQAIEHALGPKSPGMVNIVNEWRALKREASNLPAQNQHRPTPYRGHYKIDLSQNDELLTDDSHGAFPVLPKDSYQSLGPTFQSIQLTQSPPGKSKARVLGKRGRTPVDIILKKTDIAGPLKPFPATTFPLDHSTTDGTMKVLDVESEVVQSYSADLKRFREKIAARLGEDEDVDLDRDRPGHLFVEFPAEVGDRLTKAREQADTLLRDLLREIGELAKLKGLA